MINFKSSNEEIIKDFKAALTGVEAGIGYIRAVKVLETINVSDRLKDVEMVNLSKALCDVVREFEEEWNCYMNWRNVPAVDGSPSDIENDFEITLRPLGSVSRYVYTLACVEKIIENETITPSEKNQYCSDFFRTLQICEESINECYEENCFDDDLEL